MGSEGDARERDRSLSEPQRGRPVRAGRENYRKELFERAYGIGKRRHIRGDAELEAWLVFVSRVEAKRVVLELEAEPHGLSGG